MKYKQDGSLNTCCNRLLVKRELINNSYRTHESQKYANYGMNKNIKSEAEKKSIHSYIRGDRLNKIDYYLKDYKIRYSKKKGIAKLDCYYENKVLKKINKIFEITDNMKNKKKYYNKKVYNKYVVRLVFFSIIPFLGLIFTFYFSKLNPYTEKACFSECLFKHEGDGTKSNPTSNATDDHAKKERILLLIDKKTFHIIEIVNDLFLWISFTVVLLILLYICIKLLKYARIKSGKGKMSIKDYCCFCKDLFIA
ncbi:hypothetical protein PVMG_01427 [Plasmodium vivax Mauritania I]|uniref:Variable surface protein Vir35 n=1 Tax=Plasmodium vivax Mauritania I TaxID=1035515 RepID=A0A0J9TCV3_PLAVI|nr:hypothetical protein PVMG_01427 [Plasmodium vivax Mauritania I]